MSGSGKNAFFDTATFGRAYAAMTTEGLMPVRRSLTPDSPLRGATGQGGSGQGGGGQGGGGQGGGGQGSTQQGFGHYPRPIL